MVWGTMHRARVVHGDCALVMRGLEPASARLVLADPPYDIGICREWDRVGKEYMAKARDWLTAAVNLLAPGGALLVYGSPCRSWLARMTVLLEDELGMRLVQHLPWVFTQGGDSRLQTMREYAVRHEELVWFEKPHGPRTFAAAEAAEHYTDADRAVALAKGKGRVTEAALDRGRPPRTFIDIPRENSRSRERQYGHHPSMKPLALCERLIRVHTQPGDRVVVPFAGSGSEVLAASKLGREAIGAELEPTYIELMRRRFEDHGVDCDFASN